MFSRRPYCCSSGSRCGHETPIVQARLRAQAQARGVSPERLVFAQRLPYEQYLAQYPSIKVVLDVHRDAIERENGTRCAPVCSIDGRQAAQVMIICGCDNGTSVQLPAWRQNLRFAAAWERSMEAKYPGLTRPVLFSYRFYNQDLTTGSLLIEIGGHGNNLNEALYAGYLAAQGLADALLS